MCAPGYLFYRFMSLLRRPLSFEPNTPCHIHLTPPSSLFNTSRRLSFVMRLTTLGFESALFQEGDRDNLRRFLSTDRFPAGRAISLATVIVLLRSHQGARQTLVAEDVA
jgi:hypothetical protein